MNNIPYGKQHITEEDIKAVVDVLRSDFITRGPAVHEFEKAFANYIGCKYAVAVASGTAALHLSALALNVKPGDKIITTPITFAATANCVKYCGGDIVFADIDPDTYLPDIGKVKQLLQESPPGTYQGLIPVDFAGRPVNLEDFKKLADEYKLWIIEDACHAPGGYFTDSKGRNQNCGNGNFADLAVFSFHPVKHIACGEGGMITTNNEDLYKKLLLLRTHGITKDANLLHENHGGWYYEMHELGFNYRLTDIQAALGISQMKRAGENLARRKEIAENYDMSFSNLKSEIVHRKSNHGHAYHLYIIEVENRLGLYNYLKDHNIFAQIHYIPLHLQPYYKQFGWSNSDLPMAESYYKKCLSLPMFPSLKDIEQKYIIDLIYDFYKKSAE